MAKTKKQKNKKHKAGKEVANLDESMAVLDVNLENKDLNQKNSTRKNKGAKLANLFRPIFKLFVNVKHFLVKLINLLKKLVKHSYFHILLVLVWAIITALFTAIPGDLLYFPKALLINDRLSPLQKIELMWPGYLKAQATSNCVQSSLVQQELLKEITAQVAVDKEALLLSVDKWDTSTKQNCETILPIDGLKSLAHLYISQSKSETRYTLLNAVNALNLHPRVIEQINKAQQTGFKSQRALDEFSDLALSLREFKPDLANIQFLDLYQKDLEIKSLKNILETGKPIAINYQELFLASCLLSPEYEVCQSPDKFNAKWNSIAAAGSIRNQLALGRKLVTEILFYQGILADDYKQIFFLASL